MEEISETSESDNQRNESGNGKGDRPDFDPETMRQTRPGLKRLILTISVLFSFLLGLPFLLKSVEIYRSPLPFGDIDSLSAAIESSPVVFPCHFHAVFVNFTATTTSADDIGVSIHSHMQKLSGEIPFCGTCNINSKNSVYVTLDSLLNCGGDSNSWKCRELNEFSFDRNLKNYDEVFDDYLKSILRNDNSRKVYTIVVVNRDDIVGIRSVVGKYRHAWIEGRMSEEAEVVEQIAEIFVKVFMNGGKDDGSIHNEFMPVGSDGKVVLSFNLLNADPHGWVYGWDFKEIDEILLAPVVETLKPLADVTVESQVLYHTPKSSFSYWDDKEASYIFSTKDLPFFVNSNEWHLDTSTAAGGRSKVLHFVVYVPSPNECPLLLHLPDGDFSLTNGFISPVWGGVIVWNPPACFSDVKAKHPLRLKISPEELKKIFEVFMGQLRQLLGLNSDSMYYGVSGESKLLPCERGFTEWELDVLSRQHTCFNLLQCGTTLGSLSRLVQSLPRMIIMDEIGKQVKCSLEAAKLALSNGSLGIYDVSAVSSRQSRSLAEDAFYHPFMMSVSYYSFEHCFAVYSPFFLPVSLHLVLAVLREWKRYKQEKKKHMTWRLRNS